MKKKFGNTLVKRLKPEKSVVLKKKKVKNAKQQPNRLKPFFENIHFEREDNTMMVNFGPTTPICTRSIKTYFRASREEVVKSRPMIGYLHRGMEKMAENMIYNEFLPTTDRMDYIAATSNNYGYALAIEQLFRN